MRLAARAALVSARHLRSLAGAHDRAWQDTARISSKNHHGFAKFTWNLDESVKATTGLGIHLNGAGPRVGDAPGDLSGLREFLHSKEIALVKASYLLNLASTHSPFPTRDNLPEKAIVDSAMVDRAVDELEAWAAYLQSSDSSEDSPFFRFPPLAIVTYGWGPQSSAPRPACMRLPLALGARLHAYCSVVV